MLEIIDLHASVDDKPILKGLNLQIRPGEVHAIMGPNGSGKSTLSHVLAGRPGYDVRGSVRFNGQDLLDLAPEERAWAGLFLAFQYPVEIPGVSNTNFMRSALNQVRSHRGLPALEAGDFLKIMREKAGLVQLDPSFLSRPVNLGFSGGEKKRNEIFQMAMLDPQLAILDETDSGLDIDALRIVAEGVRKLRREDNSFLVITHYQRLLDHLRPDIVHVLMDGKIVRTGNDTLALELEEKGYDWLKAELA
ncbi:MAG: Fe-S cluster assembly ATPase SufC [Bacteroidetes bacterium]|jgi:Fe-S cluster assembly ATP-binding protein|nr:Fe-S cluster assembly ATPase SufC [Bacteroidota bacterium]NBY30232.1 Fe-S cluster assembly ATPase SufC [Sphingobacteriia bacterium]NDC72093.1 Fe-S cluster assembly ATPase SufC [Sphingobacteriia bacterium]